MSERITCTPGVMGGEPCIKGTRIPASAIWSFHSVGYDTKGIIYQYPRLTPKDVEAAIEFYPGYIEALPLVTEDEWDQTDSGEFSLATLDSELYERVRYYQANGGVRVKVRIELERIKP